MSVNDSLREAERKLSKIRNLNPTHKFAILTRNERDDCTIEIKHDNSYMNI